MKLFLIRHGHPNYETDSLTEAGWEHARLVAPALAKFGIDRVFTSPMGRARQTAEPFCALTGLTPSVEDWTREVAQEFFLPDMFADEAHHATAVLVDRECDRRRRGQPPAQEAVDRTHAFAACGDRLAPLHRRGGRAQGGEGEREAERQQGGGQQYLDQGEAALRISNRLVDSEAVATADISE